MAPFVPFHVSAGSNKVTCFGGVLTTEYLEPPPGRGFMFRQTYRPTCDDDASPEVKKLLKSGKKPAGPPPHLHRYELEYFKVEEGIMGVDMDGKVIKKTPEDPEFSIPANTFHGFFRHPDSVGPMTVVISATDSGRDYKLDRIYFENWYGYWHDALVHGKGVKYIQMLQIMDAGDVILRVPRWMPFREDVAYYWTVIMGRHLGNLLGYVPFHKEYTTDWDHAIAKMKGHRSFRNLVHTSYKKEIPFNQLPDSGHVRVGYVTLDKDESLDRSESKSTL